MVINRHGRRGQRAVDAGLRILDAAGIEVRSERPTDPTGIPELIRQRAAGADLIILGGGDGTFSHAVDAVLETGLPLGLLPMGNANDLARTLAIPPDPAAACRIIAAGRLRRIDLGWINGTHFFNVASIGLAVRVARRLTRDRKERWGVLAYAACGWEAMHRQRAFATRVTCDGTVHEVRTLQIAVGNGRFYGGGMTIVDDAAIDDGRLDLYALPPLRWWRLLALLPVLRWGLHRPVESILSLHGREIRIETDRSRRVNVDGEVAGRTPATFRVEPRRLDVFAP